MDLNREIETYWRELFASQLESLIYDVPPDAAEDGKWFQEGMRHALMILRHTRSDDFPPHLR